MTIFGGGACGEIINRVIVWNRICARDQRVFIENRAQGSREGAVDDVVPICCFCSKVRDDTNREAGKGPWVDLTTYARSRQVPLSHGFLFSHGYCPDCVAHYDERMAAYRPTSVWESLREKQGVASL